MPQTDFLLVGGVWEGGSIITELLVKIEIFVAVLYK